MDYSRWTDRARKVMQLANQEAQRFNHEYIGTEHMLLGLVKEGTGVAAKVFYNLDVDLRQVRREVEKLVQAGPEMITMGRLPPTPHAKSTFEYAAQEAGALGHSYIGDEHLLLGLLRDQEGVAARVLVGLGLTLSAVREEVLAILGQPAKPSVTQAVRAEIDAAILDAFPRVGDPQDRDKILGNLVDALVRLRSSPKKYRIELDVTVGDEKALLDYANRHAVDWGYDEGTDFTVEEALYESLVNNNPKICPLDLGCEIMEQTTELLE